MLLVWRCSTTAEQAQSMFVQLQKVVDPEKQRLSLKGGLSQTKSTEIFQAERRLQAAIAYKYGIQPEAGSYALSADEKRQLDNVDLYTTRTMFDVKINRWSLKDACNLSTNSLASQLFGLQVSMWGRTGTLENVERSTASNLSIE